MQTISQEQLKARLRGKKNRARGKVGENIFMYRLLALGVHMPEEVHTPWRISRKPGMGQDAFGRPCKSRIVGATPMKKVSGDIRGVLMGGRSVLAECKSYDDKLLFSCLDENQHASLSNHHKYGGLSLLCWKWQNGHSVMIWPIEGFLPRTSISIEKALALNVSKL